MDGTLVYFQLAFTDTVSIIKQPTISLINNQFEFCLVTHHHKTSFRRMYLVLN